MYDDNRTTMILYYKVVATTYGASEHFNRWRCNADDDVTPAFTWYRVSHQPCRVLKHVDAYSRIYNERPYYYTRHMGAHRIFSRGGQIRGLETKITQRGPGMKAPGVKPPKADDRL